MKKLEFVHFALAIVLISVLRILLILTGAIPPLSEMSLWNVVFIILEFILLLAIGWRFSDDSIMQSIWKGATAMFSAFIIIIIGVFIGRAANKSLLGIVVPSGLALYLVLLVNLFINMAVGAVVVAVGAFIGRMVQKKEKEKARTKRK
jgi:hypothetical protein